MVEDGYDYFAKRQLVTVFSAPNYCGEFDNAGAMMSVDENLICSFQVKAMPCHAMPWPCHPCSASCPASHKETCLAQTMYALAAPPCPAPLALQLVLTQNCAFQVLKPLGQAGIGQEVQAERQVGQEMRIRDALECAEPLPQCAWQRFCKNRNKCMLRP